MVQDIVTSGDLENRSRSAKINRSNLPCSKHIHTKYEDSMLKTVICRLFTRFLSVKRSKYKVTSGDLKNRSIVTKVNRVHPFVVRYDYA